MNRPPTLLADVIYYSCQDFRPQENECEILAVC
jgi:hypothetical protein